MIFYDHSPPTTFHFPNVAGVGGFETCPLSPNCPVFKELKNQQAAVHNLFTPLVRTTSTSNCINDDQVFVNKEGF
jgi:hypothetical protein